MNTQAIQTKTVGPTSAFPQSRIRATSPRGTILVEIPDNYAAYDCEAHAFAARTLAAKFAAEDAKRGDHAGAAYWSAKLRGWGIGGNAYAHTPIL